MYGSFISFTRWELDCCTLFGISSVVTTLLEVINFSKKTNFMELTALLIRSDSFHDRGYLY